MEHQFVGHLHCPALLGSSLSVQDAQKVMQRLTQEALALSSAGCNHLILDVYHAFEAAPGYNDQREWLHLSTLCHQLGQALPHVQLGLRVAFGEMEKACVLLTLGVVQFLCGHTYLKNEDVVHLEALLRQFDLLTQPVWVQQIMCNSPSEWLDQQGQHPPYLKAYVCFDAGVEPATESPHFPLWLLMPATGQALPPQTCGLVLAPVDADQESPFQRDTQQPSWQQPWPYSTNTLDPKRVEAYLKPWKGA